MGGGGTRWANGAITLPVFSPSYLARYSATRSRQLGVVNVNSTRLKPPSIAASIAGAAFSANRDRVEGSSRGCECCGEGRGCHSVLDTRKPCWRHRLSARCTLARVGLAPLACCASACARLNP
eukprot:scaffold194151_cov31-Tisochrysis_lutea.AAC.2